MFNFLFYFLVIIVLLLEIFFFVILIQNPALAGVGTLKFLFWNINWDVLSWYFLVVSILFIVFIVFVYAQKVSEERKISELKSKLYDSTEQKGNSLVQELQAEIRKLKEEIEILKKGSSEKKND
ncbi:MAG TPA: hypothetical protein PLN14_01790 [Candidatus Hydrothermia bacterium]|nr:hypothetical protein [Candidatus Hydrothermia bacterium]HOL23458.1 hypothetical protein [Candidatus Hydrothermia bacterium]HPO78358.1 hypothetical protein [Candidatus Hydrothermia bacterium]